MRFEYGEVRSCDAMWGSNSYSPLLIRIPSKGFSSAFLHSILLFFSESALLFYLFSNSWRRGFPIHILVMAPLNSDRAREYLGLREKRVAQRELILWKKVLKRLYQKWLIGGAGGRVLVILALSQEIWSPAFFLLAGGEELLVITNFFQCMKFKLIDIVCQVRLILASYLFTRVREILYFQVDLEGSLDRLDPLPYFHALSIQSLFLQSNSMHSFIFCVWSSNRYFSLFLCYMLHFNSGQGL